MKIGTVALIIACPEKDSEPVLLEALSDELEIATLEGSFQAGDPDPLEIILKVRAKRVQEDEEFGNYVEDLLSKPFLPDDVREHGLQWFKSKNKIEEYHRAESEARQVIADFAFKLFRSEPQRTDFILSSAAAEVRVRIFVVRGQSNLAAA
jgi:hypothetical protein